MSSYQQLTKDERKEIATLKNVGYSNKSIAKTLGRNRSTIGREIKRNLDKEKMKYLPAKADNIRITRRKQANQQHCKILPETKLFIYIEEKLKKYWSPEQISGRFKKDKICKVTISHESIYQYIYTIRPEWKKYLRCKKGKYRRRYGTKIREKRREEGKKKRIDTRAEIIENRSRVGDFEGDTILGKHNSGRILTHVDRKSGYLFADKLSRGYALEVYKKTKSTFKKIAKKRKFTITYDNGVEFSEHEMIERDTELEVYFAYPYHSWERGTNENTNGLIRFYFPKGSSFANINQRQLNKVVKQINQRPRKRLGYATPEEYFFGN